MMFAKCVLCRVGAVAALSLFVATTSFAQTVDFRDAVKSIGPATVRVMSDAQQTDHPMINPMMGTFNSNFFIANVNAGEHAGVAVSKTMIISAGVPTGKLDVRIVNADGQEQDGVVVSRDHVTGLVAIVVEDTGVEGVAMSTETAEAGLPVLLSWLIAPHLNHCESAMVATGLSANGLNHGLLYQLDTGLTPAKVGAPVVDASGVVIGVAINDTNHLSVVPASVVSRLIEAASADEPQDLFRGRLGVQLGEKESTIMQMLADSAGAEAGLEPGDKITKVDDHDCKLSHQVVSALSSRRAGDRVKIEVDRDGETLEKTIVLGTAGPEMAQYPNVGPNFRQHVFRFKDGQLTPLLQANPNMPGLPPTPPIPPNPPTIKADSFLPGTMQVERSKLEESLKRLEQEKQKMSETLKTLRKRIAEMETRVESESQREQKIESLNESFERLRKQMSELEN